MVTSPDCRGMFLLPRWRLWPVRNGILTYDFVERNCALFLYNDRMPSTTTITEADILLALSWGVERVVIGTRALKAPGWFEDMCRRFPGKIVLGIDARTIWSSSAAVSIEAGGMLGS